MRLLGIGDNTVDFYLDRAMMFPGGNAVNVAAQAARAGGQAAYLGCLGNDPCGDLLVRALTEEGVDLSRCRRAHGPNARAFVEHRDGDRIFRGSRPGVRADFRLLPADFAWIGGFDVVHSSIHSDLDAEVPALDAASRLFSYDFSNRWTPAQRAALARHVGIAFISSPEHDEEGCIVELHAWAEAGARGVVLTRGARGALALDGQGRLHRQPAARVAAIDTLGAGDAFIAGFLVAYATRGDMTAALIRGTETGAAACRELGGFGHGVPFVGTDIDHDPAVPGKRNGTRHES
jgi:fructoselysine 6-kinase